MVLAARLTVSTQADTLVPPGKSGWTALVVENLGKKDAFIGASNVSPDAGKRIAPGQTLPLVVPPGAALYIVTAEGETTVDFLQVGA